MIVRDDRNALFVVQPGGLAPLGGPDGRPIIGASSIEQLDEALAAGRLSLDAEIMAELDAPR